MRFQAKFRRGTMAVLATLLSAGVVFAQPGGRHGGFAGGGQRERGSMGGMRSGQPPAAESRAPNQEHLQQWFEHHGSLPLKEQQKALEKEPGFRDLPPQTQQRLRDQITQLNKMSPEQRSRLLHDMESMERLTPLQRQQFAGAMQQYRELPTDRRRQIAKAFHDLRDMPPPQREALMNSDRFRSQFTDQERGTLSNLLAVEPYIPAQRASDGSPPGK